jgi:hypothetical protein
MNTFITKARKADDRIIVTVPKDVRVVQQIEADTLVRVGGKSRSKTVRKQDAHSLGPDDSGKLLE